MRGAFRGRAAAYEGKADFDRALCDHNALISPYTQEVKSLIASKAPGREELLDEAAKAYRARGDCLRARGRMAEAHLDLKSANWLTSEGVKARKETTNEQPPIQEVRKSTGEIQLVNAWSQPVTFVVDGTGYNLAVGKTLTLAKPAGKVVCQVMGIERFARTINLAAGETRKVRVGAR